MAISIDFKTIERNLTNLPAKISLFLISTIFLPKTISFDSAVFSNWLLAAAIVTSLFWSNIDQTTERYLGCDRKLLRFGS